MRTIKAVLTCAVTRGNDTGLRYSAVPVTPKQISEASIEAGKAGVAIARIHVRDPETGKPSMGLELYREVGERIRDSGDITINLTTGPSARPSSPLYHLCVLDQARRYAPSLHHDPLYTTAAGVSPLSIRPDQENRHDQPCCR